MTITIRSGVPRPFTVRILSGDSGLDLTVVSTVTLRVLGKRGEAKDWPTTLGSSSTSELVATRMVGDNTCPCPEPGDYTVVPLLTVTGQSWPEEAEAFQLRVIK